MPKNKGKGGKGKRKGKRNKNRDQEKREIRFKDVGEEYGQVRKILGNCRVEVYCFDGKPRLTHVRGKFKKRIWINKDDFVLVGLREYQDGKGDVIHKYTPDEARLLRSWGEITADKAIFDDDLDDSGEEKNGELGAAEEATPGEEASLSDDSDDESEEDSEDESDELGSESDEDPVPSKTSKKDSKDTKDTKKDSKDIKDTKKDSKDIKDTKKDSKDTKKAEPEKKSAAKSATVKSAPASKSAPVAASNKVKPGAPKAEPTFKTKKEKELVSRETEIDGL